jgi:hypothetical protein
MTTAWCKCCHMRIRWYPRWGAWGTSTGTREFSTQCKNPSGEHIPTNDAPWKATKP